jgi:hypothetical protein
MTRLVALILISLSSVALVAEARPLARLPRKGRVEIGHELSVRTNPSETQEEVARNRPYVATSMTIPVFPQLEWPIAFRSSFRGWRDFQKGAERGDSATDADIDELVVSGNLSIFQFQAGLQRWTWGETFAFQVADCVNPVDLTEFPFLENPWRKLPLWGFDLTATVDEFSLQAIFVPKSRRPRLDSKAISVPYFEDDDQSLRHRAEGGGRFRTLIADALDLSLMIYSHESRLPQFVSQPYWLDVRFPRTLTSALSLSLAGESTVLRADAAWHRKEPTLVGAAISEPAEYVNAAPGVEYTTESNVTMGLQGHADYFPGTTPLPSGKRKRLGVSARVAIGESLFFLQPELTGYSGLNNGDRWGALTLVWSISSNAVWEFQGHFIDARDDDGSFLPVRDEDRFNSKFLFRF